MYAPGYYEIREEDGLLVYYHTKQGKTLKISSNSYFSLENKINSMNLPWSFNKVPEYLSVSLLAPISEDEEIINVEEIDSIPEIKPTFEEKFENMMRRRRTHSREGWWVQSNYKRYD